MRDWKAWAAGVADAEEAICKGKEVECRHIERGGPWRTIDSGMTSYWREYEYRAAPAQKRTITIPRRVVPEPMREVPEYGAAYFLADPTDTDDLCVYTIWEGDDGEHVWLARGLIYATVEDAIARAKAMLEGMP